jgi:hypothetical protein
MKKEVTTTELLEAMGAFSEEVAKEFKEVRKEFATQIAQCATKEDLKELRTATKSDLAELRDDIRQEVSDTIRQEIGRVISLFSPMVYKEDRKVNALMERLVAKRVLARSDVKDLLDIHPLVP